MLESQLQQQIAEIGELRKENSISQKEYQEKLKEASNMNVENMQKLEREMKKMTEQVITGVAKGKGFFTTVGRTLDNALYKVPLKGLRRVGLI